MLIFNLSEGFKQTNKFDLDTSQVLVIANINEAPMALKTAEIKYDGEINIEGISFNKVETMQECLFGTLFIPKLLDIAHSRYKILFFICKHSMVIIDNDTFSINIINRIKRQQLNYGTTIQRFICTYFAQIMSRDTELLSQHEKVLMTMEEKLSEGNTDNFLNNISPIRKELLLLRGYYDEICDIGKELEQDENSLFEKKQRKYFGAIYDRADRLMNRTAYLLEYAQQVRDAYQSIIDAKQNGNMEFLTVISTIFFPLTLITGWYGMNFQNMPELAHGYPWVIVLSLVVLTICIIIFKIKKML